MVGTDSKAKGKIQAGLQGKRAASVSAIKDDLTNAGTDWTDKQAVQDDNLISSRGVNDLPAFCRTITAALR